MGALILMKTLQLYKPADEIRKLAVITSAVIRNPLANQAKADLLEESANLERVCGDKSQEAALSLLARVDALLKEVEKSRKEVKEPFAEITKAIDGVAKEYVAELETDKQRLKKLLGEYQLVLDQKRREQEAAMERERQRIADEQLKIQREAEAQQRALREQEFQAKSQAEAERLKQQRVEAEQQAALRQASLQLQQANLIVVPAAKPEGMSVKRPWRVEVVDAAKLYAARPDMVELKPRQAELNKLVAGENGLRELPGCLIKQEIDVTSR